MTTEAIAKEFGGQPVHCTHSATTICRKCVVPLHCIVTAQDAYQFTDAGSLVGFSRARYDAQRAEIFAAHAARLNAQ